MNSQNQHFTSSKSEIPDTKPENENICSFDFDTFGNYDYTTVSIKATLPFRKLHLLFALPALILKAYWKEVLFGKHENSPKQNERLSKVHKIAEAETKALKQIDPITRHVNLFDDGFPNISTKSKAKFGRNLSLRERITGKFIYS